MQFLGREAAFLTGIRLSSVVVQLDLVLWDRVIESRTIRPASSSPAVTPTPRTSSSFRRSVLLLTASTQGWQHKENPRLLYQKAHTSSTDTSKWADRPIPCP